jgi:hypothetical protein
VSARRLRSGERLGGAGAVALLVLLFLNWFEPAADARGARGADLARSGWAALGWPVVLLLGLVLLLVAWLLWATASGAPVNQALAAGVLATTVATVALVALAVRLALAQPGLGARLPDRLVELAAPAYLGLAALALLTAGCWRALADERTDAPESDYVPPPARPAPPAES